MLGHPGVPARPPVPEIYEMQVRAIVRAAARRRRGTGDAPLVEIMHPLVGFAEELGRLRELTERVAAEETEVEYLCGTMIELPRACVRADEIAEYADFCSFGTNDLTQTALGFSRDDAEGKFLTLYLDTASSSAIHSRCSTSEGVGDLMRIAVERAAARSPTSSSGSAASMAASPARSRSATSSGSTTSRARRTACHSHVSPPPRRRSPRPASRPSPSAASGLQVIRRQAKHPCPSDPIHTLTSGCWTASTTIRRARRRGVVVIAIPAGTGGRGHVRIGTEDWSARSTEETPIEVGVTVEVVSIEGVAVLVRPVDGS